MTVRSDHSAHAGRIKEDLLPLTDLDPDGPDTAVVAQPELARVSTGYIIMLVLATVGTFMSYIAAMSYSLSIRVDRLAPGHEEYLGYIAGAGGVVSLLSAPMFGVLSDRTRSRLGRRRPFIVGGVLVGLLALVILGLAPNMAVLTGGWLLAVLGWNLAMNSIANLQADKLPEEQRGKVSGMVGFAQMVAPVIGIGVASMASGDDLLLLLAPAMLGTAFIIPLVLRSAEQDTRSAVFAEPLSARVLFGKYVFDPRKYVDFSWNWVGRFLFFTGLTFNTTFMTFFLAQRAGSEVDEIGGLVAASSGLSVVATAIGALGGGFLSDRLRRRRILVLGAGMIFAFGAATMALSGNVAMLIVGGAIANIGMGAFSAVDQAILLDVLPDRREAGRFMGIMYYAIQIPHAVAPLAASVLLGIGAAAGEKNYSVLYLVGGLLTIAGGLVVHQRVKGSR